MFGLHIQTISMLCQILEYTFFESSDTNIVFLSVPMTIRSFANSNCSEDNFSAPSTAAFMAAIFTRFARSGIVLVRLGKVW